MSKPSTRKSDDEPITDEMWSRAMTIDELPSTIRESVQATLRRGRGKQKAPTKQMVSMRMDPDVLEAYRATGKGWQSRMHQTLEKYAPRRRKVAASVKKPSASRRVR